MSLVSYDLFRGRIDLVEIAIARFKEFEPKEGYYLAFSGGKDSVVIKRLAELAGIKFDGHYNLTTIDPPELVQFIRREHPDVVFNRSEKMLLPQKMMERKFPPLRMQRWCCEIYKEGGGAERIVVTGVRRAESSKRSKRKLIESCYKGKSKLYLNPIIDWEDDDVWEFIRSYDVPYSSLYDEGFKRLGCVLCPCANNRLLEAARWPKIAATWKRWIVRLYDKRKAGNNPFTNWKNGEEMYEWWLREPPKNNPDQTVMFE